MSTTVNLPTLVTYRSAEEFRDAGMRFAYLRAGMLGALAVAVLSSTVAVWLISRHPRQIDSLVWLLFGLATVAGVAMYAAGRALRFPHCPRMTLEELEIMRTEMGVPDHVFRQTHDSVLHGSEEEIHAMWKTSEIIQRVMNSAGRQARR